MKFHEFRTWWDQSKGKPIFRGTKRAQAYRLQIESMKKLGVHKIPGLTRPDAKFMSTFMEVSMLERQEEWYESVRPYYKVYPCIVDSLCKLKLDFNCECPEIPEGVISIRFAEGYEPEAKDGNRITSLLVSKIVAFDNGKEKEELLIQTTVKDDPDLNYRFCFDPNHQSMTIQELLDDPSSILARREIAVLAIRIALTVCMLAEDPEIITPDVLNEQQSRFDSEADEAWKMRAKEKAKNKGVFGWSVGKNIEVTPHFRRPHFAIRHTGPGGKIPKIVRVKGCMVKYNKLAQVPTGYMLPDGTEVEDGKIAS